MRRRSVGLGAVLAAALACSGPHYDVPEVSKPSEVATPSARLREPVSWRLSPHDAEEILARTRMFVVGERSRQIQAFNVTFEQSDAERRFLTIAGRAQWAGQLYALCALGALNSAEAAEMKRRLKRVQESVVVYDRGVPGERPVADLVRVMTGHEALADLRQFKFP